MNIKLLKLEIKKAILNKMFVISIIIGFIVTLLSLFNNINIYNHDMSMLDQIAQDTTTIHDPFTPMYTMFNEWVGGECFSLGTSIFFFIFPLLATIPYGWSYCNEKASGYRKTVIVHTGKTPYFICKYFALFLSGGLAMTIPLVLNFLLTAMFFPMITPVNMYNTTYGVFISSLFSSLYYTKPLLYVFLYLCIDFVFSGLVACISMAISSFIKYKWIVLIVPFFICLGIDFSKQYIYKSTTGVVYKEISPFYFLRPVESAYSASLPIISGMALFIFVITFSICMIWERKHEIY